VREVGAQEVMLISEEFLGLRKARSWNRECFIKEDSWGRGKYVDWNVHRA
jgi:hypothetical protein